MAAFPNNQLVFLGGNGGQSEAYNQPPELSGLQMAVFPRSQLVVLGKGAQVEAYIPP